MKNSINSRSFLGIAKIARYDSTYRYEKSGLMFRISFCSLRSISPPSPSGIPISLHTNVNQLLFTTKRRRRRYHLLRLNTAQGYIWLHITGFQNKFNELFLIHRLENTNVIFISNSTDSRLSCDTCDRSTVKSNRAVASFPQLRFR